MRAFPELSVQQVLVLTQLIERIDPRERDRIWKLMSIIGRIDRVSFAYAANRQRPGRSRIFLRATGLINHQRLADWFRQDWPAAVILERKGPRGEPVTLVGSGKPQPPAFAMVGNTDLLLGGYQGFDEKHIEVVQQALELSAGRGAALPGAHTGALQELPDNTWLFARGEPPEAFKELIMFRVLPRQLEVALSGTVNPEAQLRAVFPTDADARAFEMNLALLRGLALAFLKNPPVRIMPQAAELMTGTLNGVRIEAHEDRVGVRIQVSSAALNAVAETMRDLPLSMLKQLLAPGPMPPDKR
jgi:hypothetical protein